MKHHYQLQTDSMISWKDGTGKTDLAEQGQLIKELIKVNFFIAIVVIQDVESVDDVALSEIQTHVDGVDEKHDRPDVQRPQRMTVQYPQQLQTSPLSSSSSFNPLTGNVIIVPHPITWSGYTGRWWMGCYIWCSEEGTGWGPSRPGPSSLYQM